MIKAEGVPVELQDQINFSAGAERPLTDPIEGVFICEECGILTGFVTHLPTKYPAIGYPDKWVCVRCEVLEFNLT